VKYYPAFIDLHGKRAVVIGGGNVAERKARSLIKAGARVTVISPQITDGLTKLGKKGLLKHRGRNYRKSDLAGAFIVIAGTSSSRTNDRIAGDARSLVNVIDVPSRGNFIVPSVVERGALTIAVSTGGASPAVSKAIRKEMERLYGTEFARYIRFLERIRKKASAKIPRTKTRNAFLRSLASEELLTTLRNKGFRTASREITAALERLL
jgi:precorrin-2 dehydrogenase/sirohydrochlorin ferrochelatase